MPSVLISLFTGLFGSALLYLVFKLLKTDWPNNYSNMKNVVDSASSRNMWIYLAMRFIPMYVVSVLVASLSNSTGGKVSISLVTCAVLHIFFTNLRPHILRRTFTPSKVRLRYIVISLSTSVLISVATISAALTWSHFIPLLPDSDQVVQAIWTSLFVGLAVGLIRSYGTYEHSLEKQIERAKKDLGEELQQVIQREARRHDVSADFIQAVVLTECIQRPKWIRKVEDIKGRISGPGTYGVAQIPSDSPITDEESIELLCRMHKGYYPEIESPEYEHFNRTLLSVRLEKINSSRIFVAQAIKIYEVLSPYPRETSEQYARDGKACIEILSLKREGTEWLLRISLGPGSQELAMTTITRHGNEKATKLVLHGDTTTRRSTEVRLPVEVAHVEFSTLDPATPEEVFDAVNINLEDPYIEEAYQI